MKKGTLSKELYLIQKPTGRSRPMEIGIYSK